MSCDSVQLTAVLLYTFFEPFDFFTIQIRYPQIRLFRETSHCRQCLLNVVVVLLKLFNRFCEEVDRTIEQVVLSCDRLNALDILVDNCFS